ncbi:MAG: DsrE family protein [Gammaproteobacteria bacterium]|nr:DsrE family protein [Gammaproteobacteria bacterium]
MKRLLLCLILSVAPSLLQAQQTKLTVIDFPNIPEIAVPDGMGYNDFYSKKSPAKIVFGVSDPGHQLKESLTNAAYTIKYLKPRGLPYEIELVLYGKAILTANSFNEKYASYAALYSELNKHGVVFSICNNSLSALNESADDLYDFMKVIPAGILQIAKKQHQGFAYIHNTK